MKEGGWNRYQILSDKYSDALQNVIGDENINIEKKMAKFEKIHEKIKYKSFGKVTSNSKRNKMHDPKNNKSDGDKRAQELF